MPYDLFISYSRRDNEQGRITQIVDRIKTDFAAFEGNNGRELVPFFDQQEIHGMLGSFTLAVESAAVYLGQFANDVTCTAFLARLKKEGLEGLDTAAGQSSEMFAEFRSIWQNRCCKRNTTKRKTRNATLHFHQLLASQ